MFIFILSIQHNPLTTSIIRGVYGFVIVFFAFYIIRFLIGTVAGISDFTVADDQSASDGDSVGSTVNLTTPSDDDMLNQMLKQQLGEDQPADDFVPLQPQKLVTKDKLSPELAVEAVRQMSEQ